jgi:uncharacterized membrane protein (UPF0127 family)
LVATSVLAVMSLSGCEPAYKTTEKTTQVTISGKVFNLELSIDQATRVQGLSNRKEIPENGGMLFVFPNHQVAKQEFVMRDCQIPIDIIFLDRSRRVTATHAMQVEEPRREGEDVVTYENRLKRYSSRFDAQYAIELKGGTLTGLSIKQGDQIDLDPSLGEKAK